MAEQVLDLVDVTSAARANMYYALARAFELPGDWEEDIPDLLGDAFATMGESHCGPGEHLAAQAQAVLVDKESATVAYSKLFFGPFEILAAPWASFYLEDEPLLMGETSQYAAMAYAEAGLAPSGALKDAPDHVSHELEFMYYLTFGLARTGEAVWHERQARFWRQHFGLWLPRLAEVMAGADVHPFYNALAETLVAVSASEELVLGHPVDQE